MLVVCIHNPAHDFLRFELDGLCDGASAGIHEEFVEHYMEKSLIVEDIGLIEQVGADGGQGVGDHSLEVSKFQSNLDALAAKRFFAFAL